VNNPGSLELFVLSNVDDLLCGYSRQYLYSETQLVMYICRNLHTVCLKRQHLFKQETVAY
jgi:hypothetical protein